MGKISLDGSFWKKIHKLGKKRANGEEKPSHSWKAWKSIPRRHLAAGALCLLCLALMAVCYSRYAVYGGLLPSQEAAQRWKGDSEQRFAQVSLFFPRDGEVKESDVEAFRRTVDGKLQEASLTAPENGALWTDAYSSMGKLTVSSDKASTSAVAIGISGDYFLFHPLTLRHGSYIWGEDLMKDRVVLDEELAWRLFGGVELAGLSLTIEGKPYWIAGVVAREDDPLSRMAMEEDQGYIFVDHSLLASEDTGVGCYELVAPDPVGGFALSLAEEGFSVGKISVENSSRFAIGHIWQSFRHWQSLLMAKDGIALPYWENAARVCAAYRLLYFLLMLFCGLFPAACAVYILIRQYVKLLRRYQKWRAARKEYD
ncbi:MAG: ABC transporter permease [Firmicutes bacterium]|nr:ABC transporter permease [Bacillota bacterium]